MNETEYLHDSKLISVQYDTSTGDTRNLILTMECHPEAGHPEVNGQTLCIRALDVVFLSYTAWGYVVGEEVVDDWKPSVSKSTVSQLRKREKMGVFIPEKQITVTFHSGSVLEFVCRELDVIRVE